MTVTRVVRRLIKRVGAAGKTTGDPGADPQATLRRRAGGLGLGKKLDAVLAVADDELLDYINAATNPEAELAALLASDYETPSFGATGPLPRYKPGTRADRGGTRRHRSHIPAQHQARH